MPIKVVYEKNGEFDHNEWTGTVTDLVNTVGSSDARLGPVTDKISGAKIWMNIDSDPDPEYRGVKEPFYIESPDGDNLYDARNRREAIMMLRNIRQGKRADGVQYFTDTVLKPRKKTHSGKKSNAHVKYTQQQIIGLGDKMGRRI